MTLFTKDDCKLCRQLKDQFDLEALEIHIEVLGKENADALAHLAWHGLVETARKTLPILVLDDSSSVDDFALITRHLTNKARKQGFIVGPQQTETDCADGACRMH